VPELPEVETVVRDLRPLLVGRSFARIETSRKALRRKWSRTWQRQLIGQRVNAVERRGKWILIQLKDSPLTPGPSLPDGRGGNTPWLCVHLGMTGQFTVANGAREDHTHVIFTLDNASELRFRDVRRFGASRSIRAASNWMRSLQKPASARNRSISMPATFTSACARRGAR